LFDPTCNTSPKPLSGKNRRLVTNELVEFEK